MQTIRTHRLAQGVTLDVQPIGHFHGLQSLIEQLLCLDSSGHGIRSYTPVCGLSETRQFATICRIRDHKASSGSKVEYPMKSQCHLTIAAIALVWACTATGQEVYKSVDARGRVTYSSSPPPNASEEKVETVTIAPGPTEQQRQEAMQRAKELDDDSQRAAQEQQERTREATKALSDAELELRNAEAALRDARIQRDDDWQHLVSGGRVLKQSYLDRVKDAEKRVEQAEKAVRASR